MNGRGDETVILVCATFTGAGLTASSTSSSSCVSSYHSWSLSIHWRSLSLKATRSRRSAGPGGWRSRVEVGRSSWAASASGAPSGQATAASSPAPDKSSVSSRAAASGGRACPRSRSVPTPSSPARLVCRRRPQWAEQPSSSLSFLKLPGHSRWRPTPLSCWQIASASAIGLARVCASRARRRPSWTRGSAARPVSRATPHRRQALECPPEVLRINHRAPCESTRWSARGF